MEDMEDTVDTVVDTVDTVVDTVDMVADTDMVDMADTVATEMVDMVDTVATEVTADIKKADCGERTEEGGFVRLVNISFALTITKRSLLQRCHHATSEYIYTARNF
jgi:hypothetical protein